MSYENLYILLVDMDLFYAKDYVLTYLTHREEIHILERIRAQDVLDRD